MTADTTATPLLFSMEPLPLRAHLLRGLGAESGELERRHFPDGESYIRVLSDVADRDCFILADLSFPDARYLPLVFLAETLRELGASSIGLIAPYLCYMRQDCRFKNGEAVTSRIFAQALSGHVDWLVTVDPHLHRYRQLGEIYSVPNRAVSGMPALADWLGERQQLLLIGPDAESEQWVAEVARRSGHPYVIGQKERLGDRRVQITLPDLTDFQGRAAVIIDDVIASGHTVLKCLQALETAGIKQVECAAVHGIFADGIDRQLIEAGLSRLVTSNTVPHPTNGIDVSALLVEPVSECLQIVHKRRQRGE